jgi:hypothetical protein
VKVFLAMILVHHVDVLGVKNYLFKEEKSILMKGIAIQTILMLLVGILVVGIVVYMVYRYFVGAPLNEQECRASLTTWCSSCKVMNFSHAGYTLGDERKTCIDRYGFGTGWDTPDDCTTRGFTVTSGFCAQFTP